MIGALKKGAACVPSRRAGPALLIVGLGMMLAAAAPPPIVISDITVIDTEATDSASAERPGRTVVLRDGRIAAIGGKEIVAPAGARRIDGRGKYLVPGFWDMHVHVRDYDRGRFHGDLALQLANGITGVREMGNDMPGDADQLAQLQAFRASIDAGTLPAPRLLSSPLRVTDGPGKRDPADTVTLPDYFPADEAAAIRLVDSVAAKGIDFIKVYDNMPRGVFLALMAQARRRNVEVVGHIPYAIDPREAIRAGIRSIEHASILPAACSPAFEERRLAYLAAIGEGAAERVAMRGASSAAAGFLDRVMAGYDARLCGRIIAEMARHSTYYVPTHVTRRMDAFASLREYREDPGLRFIDRETRADWAVDAGRYAALAPGDRIAFMRFYYFGLKVTVDAFRAGVPVLIGSDTGDSYIFPGYSYHLEMESLADAGMPAFDVLRSATIIAARFLGRSAEFGSIEVGKAADLVILDASPLTDIANSRRIDAVVAGGRLHDRAALDALVERAAESSR